MRQYIRHPSGIPIVYSVDAGAVGQERLKDVGVGGLCFGAPNRLPPGTPVHLTIPVTRTPFEADGVVAWCHSVESGFEVGVRFSDRDCAFALRMVEQICHIEQYRRDVLQRWGRRLSSEQAAVEWIRRYAHRFPR
jgi:hypothetical protein